MNNANDLLSNDAIFQRAHEAASTLAWCCDILAARGVQSTADVKLRRLLSVLPVPQDQSRATSANIFLQLEDAIDDGTYWEKFPVGAILPDTWTDVSTGKTYEMPWRIVDYRKVTLSDHRKAFGATLLRVYASPNDVMFDTCNERFRDSYVLQYLNAEDGYLAGCSAELREAIVATIISAPYGCVEDEICSQIFIPSPEEFHVDADQDYLEGALDHFAWEYFLNAPTDRHQICGKRSFLSPNGHHKSVWLRSHYAGGLVCSIDNGGIVYINSPCLSLGVLPACVITGRQAR